jgi:hypothetical protein
VLKQPIGHDEGYSDDWQGGQTDPAKADPANDKCGDVHKVGNEKGTEAAVKRLLRLTDQKRIA